MSRLSGTTSLVVPWTAAVIFWGVIVVEYPVLEMENGRNERDFFVARQLGRAYDVSGRSDMTSYMGGETTSAC